MTFLAGVGAFSYGAVVGGIVCYFLGRMKNFEAAALKVVLTLLGGGALLYAGQTVSIPDAMKVVTLSCYPIGLLLGWLVPTLLKWDEEQRAVKKSN